MDYLSGGFESYHEGLSAIVVNLDTNKVYLIATSKEVNYVEFRSAIQSYLGLKDSAATNDPAWKGLFLDGGASTQLRCAEAEITTGRVLCQVIVLKSKAH